MTEKSGPLQYSAVVRSHRRRWLIAFMAIAAMAASIYMVSAHEIGVLTMRLQQMASQHQCLTWTPTRGAAYSEDSAVREIPVADPTQWTYAMFSMDAGPIVFLHGRRALGGPERLVLARVDYNFTRRRPDEQGGPVAIECCVGNLASLTNNFQSTWRTADFPGLTTSTPKPVVIEFGQADPTDDLKFSFRFRTPRSSAIVTGQLMPDDTVSFKVTTAAGAP